MKLLTLLLLGCLAAFFFLSSIVPVWASIGILTITAIVFGRWCGKAFNFLFNRHENNEVGIKYFENRLEALKVANKLNRATLDEEESDESVDMEEDEYNENEWAGLHNSSKWRI